MISLKTQQLLQPTQVVPLVVTGSARHRSPDGFRILTNSSSNSALWWSVLGAITPDMTTSKVDAGWFAVIAKKKTMLAQYTVCEIARIEP